MVLDAKARRRHRFDAGQTPFQFVDSAARAAKKVMMMPFVGPLISRHLAGDFHGNHAAVLGKRLEEAIDRRYSKRRDFLERQTQNFRRSQRILVRLKHGLDGPLLSRASFHDSENRGVRQRVQRRDNFLPKKTRVLPGNGFGSPPKSRKRRIVQTLSAPPRRNLFQALHDCGDIVANHVRVG